MAKASEHQVVSANDLMHGYVVYFDATDRWTTDVSTAAVATGRDAAAELLARAATQQSVVVGPYLVNVALDATGRPAPSHMREVMRETGPTVALQYVAASAAGAAAGRA